MLTNRTAPPLGYKLLSIFRIQAGVIRKGNMNLIEKVQDGFEEKAPEIVKQNKGALLGALVGYFISDNEKAKSVLLGLVAGAVTLDKKKDEE